MKVENLSNCDARVCQRLSLLLFHSKRILDVIASVSDLILEANLNYQFSISFPVACLSLGFLSHLPPNKKIRGWVKTWMQIVHFLGDSRKQE